LFQTRLVGEWIERMALKMLEWGRFLVESWF